MTWQPTKTQLEDAARASCKTIRYNNTHDIYVNSQTLTPWQPHLPTTQGKADLQDLQVALLMDVEWIYVVFDPSHVVVTHWIYSLDGEHVDNCVQVKIKLTNNDKHAALAQAVLEVAAQVGAKMRGEVC